MTELNKGNKEFEATDLAKSISQGETGFVDSSVAEKAVTSKDAADTLAKYDKESTFRIMGGFWGWAAKLGCVSFSFFQLYTAAFGQLPTQIQRAFHLLFTMSLIFLLYPFGKKSLRDKPSKIDIALVFLTLLACGHLIVNYEAIILRAGIVTPADYFFGAIMILLVLEVARRTVGLPITIVAVVFIIYAKLGNYIPGLLGHKGFPWRRVISQIYLTTEGIIGMPVGVSTEFVFIFILFGAFLHKTGLGKFFIDLALALTGHQVGGPAKVAVVASGFFGTISGSSVANVVTTGAFTIPLMKGVGYRPAFAGAVEAASSTGGQIMPPIMGAAAFIMSTFIEKPYIEIAICAAIPAILYYISVGLMVHMEALRTGLKGIPKSNLPVLKKVMVDGWYLIIPIVVMLYMLLKGYTPSRSALICIIVTMLVAMLAKLMRIVFKFVFKVVFGLWRGEYKGVIGAIRVLIDDIIDSALIGIKNVFYAMEDGARTALGVAAACACTGIVIGVVTLSGVGLKIANAIVLLSGGNFFFTLMLTMVASIILGMGLPTTAKYIVLATMAAPAILLLGEKIGMEIPTIAVHLFIMYFGIFADLTPPVALAAYAAAGIAKANPNTTGFLAVKLALAGFIIPYIFVYNPELLLINTTWYQAIFYVGTALAGIFALAFCSAGYWLRGLNIIERLMLLVGAVSLIFPGIYSDLLGAGMMLIVYALQKVFPRGKRQ
ncbi:MAG: TRAP transporter permease [Synergistaceae bacterium]|nr:TRAP transporter permease [Synergistaceae bacterium]